MCLPMHLVTAVSASAWDWLAMPSKQRPWVRDKHAGTHKSVLQCDLASAGSASESASCWHASRDTVAVTSASVCPNTTISEATALHRIAWLWAARASLHWCLKLGSRVRILMMCMQAVYIRCSHGAEGGADQSAAWPSLTSAVQAARLSASWDPPTCSVRPAAHDSMHVF